MVDSIDLPIGVPSNMQGKNYIQSPNNIIFKILEEKYLTLFIGLGEILAVSALINPNTTNHTNKWLEIMLFKSGG